MYENNFRPNIVEELLFWRNYEIWTMNIQMLMYLYLAHKLLSF